MKHFISTACVGIMLAIAVPASAQFPTPSEHHKILKMEEGEWDAKLTMFMGPEGAYDEPVVTEGDESNRMIGEYWIVSDFSADFGELSFTGHGQFGYDESKGKYFGTWVDSFSPNITKMVGGYDAESKTMTYESSGVGPDGKPFKGKNVVVYNDDDHRTMTMYMPTPGTGELAKSMVIEYTRSK